MKKTAKKNIPVSRLIGDSLGFTFENEEFPLGNWGHVDNWAEYSINTLILLECERSQKHPNTNILKLWPYLDEYPNVHVILIHYFFPENKAPKNRVALCDFVGKKLEAEFGIRFQYVPLRCSQKLIKEELEKYDVKLMSAVLATRRMNQRSQNLITH